MNLGHTVVGPQACLGVVEEVGLLHAVPKVEGCRRGRSLSGIVGRKIGLGDEKKKSQTGHILLVYCLLLKKKKKQFLKILSLKPS